MAVANISYQLIPCDLHKSCAVLSPNLAAILRFSNACARSPRPAYASPRLLRANPKSPDLDNSSSPLLGPILPSPGMAFIRLPSGSLERNRVMEGEDERPSVGKGGRSLDQIESWEGGAWWHAKFVLTPFRRVSRILLARCACHASEITRINSPVADP